MKARGIYEIPAVTILLKAQSCLEALVLDRETLETKHTLSEKFASLLYEGKWFTPLREALQAFFASTQELLTGEVRLRLYKGNLIHAGSSSEFSLYSEEFASFTTGELYHHRDAEGFISLYGLPMLLRARMQQRSGSAELPEMPELFSLSQPVKTTVSKVKKADKKQAVRKTSEKKKTADKSADKKKSGKKEDSKAESGKKETVKKTAVKKVATKKTVAKKTGKKLPQEQ